MTDEGLIYKIHKTAHTPQYQQKPNQKITRPKKTFLQRRYTDEQEAHENMFNIHNYSNQNCNETSSYVGQNGHHQIVCKQ